MADNDTMLTDDYVADLLAQDANDCSLKYSAMGMEAFRSDSSSKKPANKPKPNTRFLKHIIKDTNTHNKALLAKESAESKARLEVLEQAEEARRLKTNPNTRDIRKRQLGDIAAILGGGGRSSGSRRKRDEDDEGRRSEGSSASKARKGTAGSTKEDLFQDNRSHKRHRGRLDQDTDHKRSRRRGEESDDDRRNKTRDRRDRDRSRSPTRRHKKTGSEPESRHGKYRDRSPTSRRHGEHDSERSRRSKRSPSPRRRRRNSTPPRSPGSASDPLDDMIGPMPAPKPRGRGAVTGSSGIDRRFSESYDPKTDVQMEDDHTASTGNTERWDDAVEAFRDRQKLKQNQEARLRSAGFDESHIEKIQAATIGKSSGEKTEADVQWSKAGEKREWDRGKVSEEDDDDEPLTLLGEDI